jgi:hypothetical protein
MGILPWKVRIASMEFPASLGELGPAGKERKKEKHQQQKKKKS